MRTLLLLAAVSAACALSLTPEQVHIAYNNEVDQMAVTWVTQVPFASGSTLHQEVQYGKEGQGMLTTSNATAHTYAAGGFNGTIWTAAMSNLASSSAYTYRVGGPSTGYSAPFTFNSRPTIGSGETVRFLAYGDEGIEWSDGTNAHVGADASTGQYSLLVNVGDTSYADDYGAANNSWVLDEFFRRAQPYAARVPYMVAPGNHDSQFDFAAYLNRTIMPTAGTGPLRRFYYSFDWGPVHFVSFSTEHDFSRGSEQWEFLRGDLEAAGKNKDVTPWILVWAHRPLYCSDLLTWETRCVKEAGEYREAIEELLAGAGVDVYMCGHNHQAEVTWPVFNGTTTQHSYHDAPATTYVVNGAAGDKEGIDPTFVPWALPWRAWTSTLDLHTMYTRVTVNSTAMAWEFVDSDTGAPAHSFTLTKSS